MSKYTISHVCGHTETVQIYGPTKDRDRKAEWMESKPCRECAHAAREVEHAAANAAAAEAAKAEELPSLSGSEKQISWAETIRQSKLNELRNLHEMISEQREKNPSVADICITIIESAMNETRAAWWIDHRETLFDRYWIGNQYKQRIAA